MIDEATISAVMSHLSRRRKVHAGGRPRSRKKRCPCGLMTFRRAEARGRSAEHDPSCSFYKAR